MLIEKQTTPFIRVFKLVSGEEVIARVVSEDDKSYGIERPLQMGMSQHGPHFAPIAIMMDTEKTLNLLKSTILLSGPPVPGLESQYESVITGIALPQKSSIIT